VAGLGEQLPTVPATATVGAVVARFAGSPDIGAVPVVVPRAERPYGVASGEILGAVSPARLGAAVAEDRIRPDERLPLDPPLPVVGVGESLPATIEALADHDGVIVLEDGRALAVVSRAVLMDRTREGVAG
jgi:cystathionine beta-synthase